MVIPKNVSMYQEQWEIVEAVNVQYGFRNTSTALRFIVNEYDRLKEQVEFSLVRPENTQEEIP